MIIDVYWHLKVSPDYMADCLVHGRNPHPTPRGNNGRPEGSNPNFVVMKCHRKVSAYESPGGEAIILKLLFMILC